MLFFVVRYPKHETDTAYVEARLLPIRDIKPPHDEIDAKISAMLKPFNISFSSLDYDFEETRKVVAFSDYPHYFNETLGRYVTDFHRKVVPNPNPVIRVWKVREYKIVGLEGQPFVNVKKALENFVHRETAGEYYQIDDLSPATRHIYTEKGDEPAELQV